MSQPPIVRPLSLRRTLAATAAALLLAAAAVPTATAAAPQSAPAAPAATGPLPPVPVDAVLSLHGHNGRSPVNLSPDGEWLAHTIQSADRVERGASFAFADTGFPFAEGDARMEATLTHLRTGEEILLGAPDAASWAPAWSPDGARVAFYSDAGGTAGLWIWERDTRTSRRIDDAIVRPFFGFEAPRWDASGERLLVKLLPEGVDLAAANALLSRQPRAADPAAAPESGRAEVTVRLSSAAMPPPPTAADAEPGAPAPPSEDPLERRRLGMAADLAILHLATGRLERIVRAANLTLYAFSPDGTRVAYSADAGYDADAQQALFDMHVIDLASGADRVAGSAVPLRYGIEWSWSPDGGALAWTRSGTSTEAEGGKRGVEVVDLRGNLSAGLPGPPRRLAADAPHLSPGEGEIPPIWSPDGDAIYGIGDGSLWRIAPDGGTAEAVATVEGWQLRRLVTAAYDSTVAWSRDGGDTLWLFGRADEDGGAGLFAVRPATGQAELRMADARAGYGVFSVAASETTGEILFTARSQQQPGELFALDTRAALAAVADLAAPPVRRVSGINGDLLRYALGEARRIEFRSAHGEDLAATLLLPPGHDGGPLPTVVWVYAENMGSGAIHRFGLWSSSPVFNMHVLASRGYAVLYPDMPVRTGHLTEDLVATVLPAVDAAVEAGLADPDRLALMGQSFGSINALAVLTRTDRFRAAIITAAVLHPDLFADYLRNNTGYYEHGQGDMGGTIWEVPDRYRANSPLFEFDRITTPLLIGQGELDGDLVPSEAIFSALERLGKHVEYRIYGGESHVITGAANVRDFWQRRLEFLAEHLRLQVAAGGSVSVPR